MTTRKTLVAGAVGAAILALAAGGAYAARGSLNRPATHQDARASVQPKGELLGARPAIAINAPAASGAPANGAYYPYPYPGGTFQPGPPPFGQTGFSGDGLSVYGVAYKETSDSNATPDTALIKSAYEDAQKRTQELALATGLKLGKLAAITDYTQAVRYFKACVEPMMGAPATVPQGPAPNGSAGSGSATSSSGTVIVSPPRPVPAPSPCNGTRYLVAWVLVRYAI